MGGYGSGRTGRKTKADQCKSLDVNWLHRQGCLTIGKRGNFIWSYEGVESGRVDYHTTAQGVELDYRVRQSGGPWESIMQTIPIIHADCNFGGTRPYFRCNGVVNGQHCARRVGKVFVAGRYFLCRHCNDVAYDSQSEARYDRMLRRANKIRMALGGRAGTAHFVAPKPKGMWERTYQRKRFEISHYENQANQLFLSKYHSILSKDELDMYFGDVASQE